MCPAHWLVWRSTLVRMLRKSEHVRQDGAPSQQGQHF